MQLKCTEHKYLLETFQKGNECELWYEHLAKATSVTLFCLLEPTLSVEAIAILQNFVQQHQPGYALSDPAQYFEYRKEVRLEVSTL